MGPRSSPNSPEWAFLGSMVLERLENRAHEAGNSGGPVVDPLTGRMLPGSVYVLPGKARSLKQQTTMPKSGP